ncbi:hypothetical protein BH24CHL6_BH24CHL6_08110 [soil metagenome]
MNLAVVGGRIVHRTAWRTSAMNADEVIAALALRPHPEGGWFTDTWREPAVEGARPASTAI